MNGNQVRFALLPFFCFSFSLAIWAAALLKVQRLGLGPLAMRGACELSAGKHWTLSGNVGPTSGICDWLVMKYLMCVHVG